MKTKICSGCKKRKPLDAYTKNRARTDGLNHSCKVCHRAYTQRHYEEHKGAYLEKAGQHRRAHQARARELIVRTKQQPCADCEKEYPYYVMDCDHVRGTKVFEIGGGGRRYSLTRLRAELEKCDVVCANCHRVRTHARIAQRTEHRPTKPG